ncbi:protection of telomeres protein 1 [Mytilus galloprovincialis]|uniref:Protection of telomeres protein 1 n=1 Tax=Mytilus galloprovincialis TaxID=29158 RepID=A0A8B6BE58_MYTGA|nr:protection of telomeres protein 1 [Mytilus galloprovincialis]
MANNSYFGQVPQQSNQNYTYQPWGSGTASQQPSPNFSGNSNQQPYQQYGNNFQRGNSNDGNWYPGNSYGPNQPQNMNQRGNYYQNRAHSSNNNLNPSIGPNFDNTPPSSNYNYGQQNWTDSDYGNEYKFYSGGIINTYGSSDSYSPQNTNFSGNKRGTFNERPNQTMMGNNNQNPFIRNNPNSVGSGKQNPFIRNNPNSVGSGKQNPYKNKFSWRDDEVIKKDNPEANKYYCDTCDRGFSQECQYTEHCGFHKKCSYTGCSFVAAPKLVNLHVQMQHKSGLAKKIWSVESQDDIEKWKEERRLHKDHCLFCGKEAQLKSKLKGNDVFPVRTDDFQKRIEQVCNDRDDEWAVEVRGRLECVGDLHAADALYHQTCSVNFRTSKKIPKAFSPDSKGKENNYQGRPAAYGEQFLKIVDYLKQHEDEQITIAELVNKMNEEFYHRPTYQNPDDEKKAIIDAAAKLIKSDIRSLKGDKENYPLASDVSSLKSNLQYVPESLSYLLETMFAEKDSKMKIASIGQAIVQASRPRVLIAPLQIGLGIQLHHNFASRFLVSTLNNLGFCSSYQEIQKFESSAALTQGVDIPGEICNSFIQFVADNVDHNVRTLDGNNTFHGMGIIAGITPGTKRTAPIPRISVSSDDINSIAKVNIQYYKPQNDFMTKLNFSELRELRGMDKDCMSGFTVTGGMALKESNTRLVRYNADDT